ncbi:hypothetical protein RB594_001812 [Gaeumannomyces avenae]
MSSNNDNNDSSQTTQNSEAEDARGELTAQLEDLLNTLSNKFAGVSSEIFAKSKLADPLVASEQGTLACVFARIDPPTHSGRDVTATRQSRSTAGRKGREQRRLQVIVTR